jgi:predicted  nucleic acid-binding Zn-ribbon protein
MEAELDRVTERIIIPWFCTREDPVVTLAQALTSPLHKVVAQLGAVATALLASTEGAKKAVIDVQSIGSSLKDSAESLDKTFGKKSVFITGITALSQEITRFESFRETILKQLAGTNTAVEKHSTSAEGMLKELSILSKVVIQSNADSRRDLGHLVEQTKTHYETTLNQIVKAMKDTVSTFTKDTSAATSKMVHDVVVAHGKESGAAAGLMARSAEAVTKGMTQYDDALKSAREDLKSGFDSVTRQMSNINGALDKMVQRKPDIDSKIIEDGFKSAREDLKSGFDSITRQITNTNEAIDKMVQRKPDIDSKTIEDGFAAVRQMREAIHTMSERLATISDIIVRKNLEDYVRVGDPAPVAEKAPETNQSLQMGSGAGEGVTRDSPFSDATNHGSGG